MSEVKLEPCPFCGSDDLDEVSGGTYTRIKCTSCVTYGPSGREPGAAQEGWNNREPLNAQEIPAEAIALLPEFDLDKYDYRFRVNTGFPGTLKLEDSPYEYWNMCAKSWCELYDKPGHYVIIRCLKVPAWEMTKNPSGVTLSRGDSSVYLTDSEFAEMAQLAADWVKEAK